jgi:hypothetical protein
VNGEGPDQGRGAGGQALKVVGVALLCAVYGVVGAGLLWLAGASFIRAVLVAGAGTAVTIAAAMVLLRRLRDRRAPTLVTLAAVHLLALVLVVGAVVALPVLRVADFGDPGDRVVSPDGRFEVVTYEFQAMIDPGWTLVVERIDGGGGEWFWHGVESPGPVEVRFTGPTTVEMTDDYGDVWTVTFDPGSLVPSDRFCTRPEYCYRWPLDTYSRTSPADA